MKNEKKGEFIPIKPISINQCWQGKRYRTTNFKKWQELVCHSLPKKQMILGEIGLIIHLYLDSILKSDIDNFLKPLIDCLVKKKYIKDDRYINYLEVRKFKSEQEGFFFKIIKL